MLQLLLFALAVAQDPKPSKTVEERINELTDRIAVLDKKAADLTLENFELRRKLNLREATRDSIARGSAETWMKRHGNALGLDESQASRLQALWQGWVQQDFEKQPDRATWKSREATLRTALTPEQATLLEKSIRAEQETQARAAVKSYGTHAGLVNVEGFITTVMTRLSFDDAGLIPLAHGLPSSTRIHAAVEASVPDLAPALSEEEMFRLRKQIKERGAPRKEK